MPRPSAARVPRRSGADSVQAPLVPTPGLDPSPERIVRVVHRRRVALVPVRVRREAMPELVPGPDVRVA